MMETELNSQIGSWESCSALRLVVFDSVRLTAIDEKQNHRQLMRFTSIEYFTVGLFILSSLTSKEQTKVFLKKKKKNN